MTKIGVSRWGGAPIATWSRHRRPRRPAPGAALAGGTVVKALRPELRTFDDKGQPTGVVPASQLKLPADIVAMGVGGSVGIRSGGKVVFLRGLDVQTAGVTAACKPVQSAAPASGSTYAATNMGLGGASDCRARPRALRGARWRWGRWRLAGVAAGGRPAGARSGGGGGLLRLRQEGPIRQTGGRAPAFGSAASATGGAMGTGFGRRELRPVSGRAPAHAPDRGQGGRTAGAPGWPVALRQGGADPGAYSRRGNLQRLFPPRQFDRGGLRPH